MNTLKRKLDIQFFAEDDKSLDELLKENPSLQAEFDKKLEGARGKWQKSWQEKAEAEKAEAERLAKLTAEEKQQEAIRKLTKEKEESEATLNAYKLEVEAQKMASEKKVDIALLKSIDYRRETTESVSKIIDDISNVFNKAVENAVNEKLKQKDPQSHDGSSKSAEKAYLDEKYKNNPYYKG